MSPEIHHLPFTALPHISRGQSIVNCLIVSKKLGAKNIHSGITRLPVGGVCFIKDISTATPWKVTFTKVLDDLMTGGDPVHYFPVATMRGQLEARGMHTTAFHLWDYIPFPHVIYVARKWR